MAQNQFFYHLHTLYCFSVMILSVIKLDSLKFRVSSGRCSTNAFSEIRSFSEPLLFHLFAVSSSSELINQTLPHGSSYCTY